MTILEGTFDEAMRFVAERRLFAEMQKQADAEKAKKSHGARQSLGVLGANEGGINKAVSSLRKGEISPGKAERSIRSNVPGVLPQIKNVLRPFSGSVGTAIRQNRVGDALSQADVLGLKNLNPASEEFSPTTATASAGLGIGTGLLQSRIADNKTKYEVMKGGGGGKADPMAEAVKVMNKGKTKGSDILARWRRSDAKGMEGHKWLDPYMEWMDKNKYTAQAKPGITSWLKKNLLGPSMQFKAAPVAHEIDSLLPPLAKMKQHYQYQQRSAKFNTRERMMQDALNTATKHHRANLPVATKGLNMLGAIGLPAAAASLPLLYREWLGRGYRSGRRPAHDLVEANKP